MAPRLPERIDLDDLLLVRHRPRHAAALAAAIGDSIEHLAPARLGFELTGSFARDVLAPGEAGRQQVWVATTPTSG